MASKPLSWETAALFGITGCLLVLVLAARPACAACLGDCNDDAQATVGDLTKMIGLIIFCDGAVAGCTAMPDGCANGDKNGDGFVTAGELTNVVFDILTLPMGCPEVATPTPTPLPATPTPAATATPAEPPLGSRTFSLGSGSGFFSSLVPSLKAGSPGGTLVLDAGPPDANGRATVTLANAPAIIRIDVALGGLVLCTQIESCTGQLFCDGGGNVDVITEIDSLAPGLTCIRDGTNACPDMSSSVCCSNACEGVGVGSGNPITRRGGVNPEVDSGPGAMLLTCMQRVVTIDFPGDCAGADFSTATLDEELYTTGDNTAQVPNHCASTPAAPPDKVPRFTKTGENFDCSQWTMEDGPGAVAFSIPSEEGSDIIKGDGANAGVFSDQ
ncbi:MAG: hypothetical protein ACE5I7_16330 [Candidatus Binatia bacterium]